jgi:hypothetical protein
MFPLLSGFSGHSLFLLNYVNNPPWRLIIRNGESYSSPDTREHEIHIVVHVRVVYVLIRALDGAQWINIRPLDKTRKCLLRLVRRY